MPYITFWNRDFLRQALFHYFTVSSLLEMRAFLVLKDGRIWKEPQILLELFQNLTQAEQTFSSPSFQRYIYVVVKIAVLSAHWNKRELRQVCLFILLFLPYPLWTLTATEATERQCCNLLDITVCLLQEIHLRLWLLHTVSCFVP